MALPALACALIGRFSDARVAESALTLLPHLRKRGVKALLPEHDPLDVSPELATRVPEEAIADQANLVIAIGGDGTLLYAARLVAHKGVPLIGINRGRLGFLTDVLPQDMLASVDAAIEGRCERDERALLEARLISAGGATTQALALNDVVLQKWETGRMLDFETWIDGAYVNSHGGDGLVVASSTGSTAYALSCGGPIVAPHLDALVVAPICPHTLSDRPIVVSGRSVIAVKLIDRPDTRAQVTCDGVSLGELAAGDRLEVHPTSRRITLLHPNRFEYYRLLRSKLHWGRGSFNPSE
ncbi:MAG TPA: NAD(+)/NADH kinase [Steroidobacteraceae bacterium]|jgi:NAD+ kinase|nr:NAD(+)/NADH kinase [Steroidobacteraceae bacterium]